MFVNRTEIYKFKAKDSEIAASALCLGNISKDWSVDNMRRIGFTGYVYDFSVGYDDIGDIDDIKNIHKYLMEKNDIVWNKWSVMKKMLLYMIMFIQQKLLTII